MPFLVEMEASSGLGQEGRRGCRESLTPADLLGTALPRVCDTFPQLPLVDHSTHGTENVDSNNKDSGRMKTTV